MGSSPRADVQYGIDFGLDDDRDDDALPLWWRNRLDWVEVLARQLGWDEVPYPPEPEGYYDLHWRDQRVIDEQVRASPEFAQWQVSRAALRDIITQSGIEMRYYGWEHSGRCLRVKASIQSCEWGSTPLSELIARADWDQQVRDAAELLELPMPDEGPGWFLTATYG